MIEGVEIVNMPDGTRMVVDHRGGAPKVLYPKDRKTTRQAKKNSVPIGDWVEAALTTVGITKERYMAIKAAVGLPENCNCDKRKEWLNKVGEQFGEAVKSSLSRLFKDKNDG